MGSLIGLVLSTGIPAKYARFVAYGALILALLLVLGVGKCTYDRAVIAKHDAKQEAATAKADRKADATAAVKRRADDARQATVATEIKEAVSDAKANGLDPRAAYYHCVQLQQAARRGGQPPADC